MKRKILITLTVLILLLVALLTVISFKLGDIVVAYKPQLEAKLSEALGARVQLDEISLSIIPSPHLSVQRLAIRDRSGAQAGLSVGSLSAEAALMPLLSKRLEISSITVKNPRVILQKVGSEIRIKGVEPRSPSAPSQSPTPSSAPATPTTSAGINPLTISIERIVVSDGELRFEDTTTNNTYTVGAIELDAGVTLGGERIRLQRTTLSARAPGDIPVSVAANSSTFHPATGAIDLPDLQISLPAGKITATISTQSSRSGKVTLSSSAIDLAKLTQMLRTFSPNLPPMKPEGSLEFRLAHDLSRQTVDVEKLSVKGFGGELRAPTSVSLGTAITIATKPSADGLSITKLLSAFKPELAGSVSGTLSQLRAELSGINAADPVNSTAGSGTLILKDGAVKGLNIPAQALAKIDSLPFLKGNLRQRVPPEFESIFAKPDTDIKELRSNFSVARGILQLSHLVLESDVFSLRGGGAYKMSGETNFTAELLLNQAVSSGITARVKELAPLVNAQGQLVIPLTITGKLPAVIVTPNIDAILKNVSISGVAQALDGVLKDKKVGSKLGKILGF